MPERRLTLQTHLAGGAWHDAAALVVANDALGIRSPTALDYETGYFVEHGSMDFADDRPVTDARALSVRHPLDLAGVRLETWPPFLLDLLPQGHARRRLATELGFNPDDATFELPLLLRGAGGPIGNIRVKEAWEEERQRIDGMSVTGVTTEQVFVRDPAFAHLAETFALIASGSSGAQGEWPKILMTEAEDGLWYPDPVIEDGRARDHAIVKMSRAKFSEDRQILKAEAPYLEVAREFGLRVGEPLAYRNDTLMIPRFDRRVGNEGVVRLGQESLVSAAGVAEFGFVTTHEHYLRTIMEVCTDPVPELIEYVLREVLASAMGDTDNHGRNTALQKHLDGRIALTPLFDFAPMTLSPDGMARSSTWECLRGGGAWADYRIVAEAVGEIAGDEQVADRLRAELGARAETVRTLPEIARRHGVEEEVIERGLRYAGDVADALRAAAPAPVATPSPSMKF